MAIPRHKQTIVAKLFNNEASSFENLSILTEARHTKFGKSSNVSLVRAWRAGPLVQAVGNKVSPVCVSCVCPLVQ